MALKLKRGLSLNSKILLEYWRVTALNIDYHHKIAILNLSGYISEEDRRAGGNAIENLQFIFRENQVEAPLNGATVPYAGIRWPFVPGCNVQQVIYQSLKRIPDWAGAEDLDQEGVPA